MTQRLRFRVSGRFLARDTTFPEGTVAVYKYLLCWRYLKTRYIALASVVSVMLGVATMIVVNSVMAGFADKMKDRLHGVLADVDIESFRLNGFYDWKEVMARVKQVAGEDIVAMAPTMECPGILHFRVQGEVWTKPVQIIGITPEERAKTGDFAEFLVDTRGRRIAPSFVVPEAFKEQTPAGEMLKEFQAEPTTDPIDHKLARRSEGVGRAAGPRPRRDPRLRTGDHPPEGPGGHLHRAAGHAGHAGLPQVRRDAVRGGLRDAHHRRLLQERDERVRLDPRLRAAGDPAASPHAL